MPDFIEIGPLETPLQRFITQYEQQSDTKQLVELLRAAQHIAANEADLAQERETIRRDSELSHEELEHLAQLAEQAGEESYGEQFAMMEAIQAAAIPVCNLLDRNMFSIRLAVAAKLAKKFERARQSYADVVEGVQIFGRFFKGDDIVVANAEASARRGWDAVKSLADGQLEIFDPATADAAEEWIQLILWNTDVDSGGGLLAQIDATMRLALRFKHWLDKGQPLAPHVDKMRSHFRDNMAGDTEGGIDVDMDDRDSSFVAACCLVTLGDALIEVRQWGLAANAHQDAGSMVDAEGHPLGMFAAVQEAYCYLMTGDLGRCRARLDGIDKKKMETLSELILTVAAVLARYCAVDHLCMRSSGVSNLADPRVRIEKLLQRVRMIVSWEPADRTGYLRNLFFSVLARDVDAMLAET